MRGEADSSEGIIEKFYDRGVKRALDVGRGARMQSVEQRRGYGVVGISVSEDIVDRAREKAEGMGDARSSAGGTSGIELKGLMAIATHGSVSSTDDQLTKSPGAMKCSSMDRGLIASSTRDASGVIEGVYYEVPIPELGRSGGSLTMKGSPRTVDLMEGIADLDTHWSIIDLSEGSVDPFDHEMRPKLLTPRGIKYILRSYSLSSREIRPGYELSPFPGDEIAIVRASPWGS